MNYKVDYHTHSYHSDGTMKPTDLVKMYKNKEYDMIALTDHDGVDGVAEAVIAGDALEMKVIPGIELAASYDFQGEEVELHILGYHIDIDNQPLREKLKELRENRNARNEKLLALLNEMGYELVWEDLLQRPGQTYVGKPNFARALKEKGYEVPNMWDVFDSVEKKKISSAEAIELIKGAGGIAVLAHPLKTKKIGEIRSEEFWSNLDTITRELKKEGLKGMECFHPSADQDDSWKLAAIAGKYHLHITEGSDFHGDEE